jgi:hypothetical protein
MLSAQERAPENLHELSTIMHAHMLALGLHRAYDSLRTASGARAPEARAMAAAAVAAATAALEARACGLRKHERTVRSEQSRASSSSASAYLGNGARLSGEGQTADQMADGEARSRSPALSGW